MSRVRWGVHPVLEAALAVLGEDRAERVEHALPPPVSLDTARLVVVATIACEHARPLVSSRDRARFEHLVSLVQRERGDRVRDDAPWKRELHNARRDREHGRGALVVAALAAEIAWADLLRDAPGAGLDAVRLASEATERTAKLLAKDEDALVAFVTALARGVT